MSSGKGTRMQNLLQYRMRITLADGRQLVGEMMAFDRHMNIVMSDCEEFRTLRKRKTQDEDEREERRSLGLVILRGEQIISLSVVAPPPNSTAGRRQGIPGPGSARPIGRGMPIPAVMASHTPGLLGPVRGVGGGAGFAGGIPPFGFQSPQGSFAQPPPGFRPPPSMPQR